MKTILPLSANVESLQAYESARSLLKGNKWIFMDANESPFAGTEEPLQLSSINRYPDPTADALRNAIAAFYKVKQDNVLITNGSDELIDLSVRTFVRKDRAVASFKPTYGMYKVSADINGVAYRSVDLDEDFQLSEKSLLQIDDADLLFLCNPNNPTGTLLGREKVEKIVSSFRGLVVVDEAYGEFADAEGINSSVDLVKEGAKNLLVLRTFSKAFGAAGIRLGYGIGNEEIIKVLLKMKPPYNVNALSQTCGLKLWNARGQMEKSVALILQEKQRLMEGCKNLGCKIFPSVTNFFLVQLPASVDSNEVYQQLCDKYRIVLRKIKGVPQKNILRISVGSPKENDLLLSSLSSLL